MPNIVAQKSDWIKLGFQLFAQQGEAGLNVEEMARKLTCNRSSFYWHFKTKQAFMQEVVAYWKQLDTEDIIALVETKEGPAQKLTALIQVAFKQDPYMDFVVHLKRYAVNHAAIQEVIAEVDQRRIQYVQQLLEALGHKADEAQLKAHVFYKYLMGYHETIRYKSQPKDYLKPIEAELDFILSV